MKVDDGNSPKSSNPEYVDLSHLCLLDLASFVNKKKQTEL
jgi:hypothetical protein